jgi:hypothetical protein
MGELIGALVASIAIYLFIGMVITVVKVFIEAFFKRRN